MSVVEHPNSWFPEFNIESGDYKYDIIAKMVDSKKKCCDNCAFFSPVDERYEYGFCMKNVTNELSGQYILDSDTFYCSYHKLRLNNE